MDQKRRNTAGSEGGLPQGGFAAMVPELDVMDLEASLAFWTGPLGFRIAYSRPEAHFAYLERDALQIMLCQVNGEWLTGALVRPFGRGVNFQMAVEDVEALAGRITAAGWPLFRPLERKSYRVGEGLRETQEFLVQDPDGYLLRFSQGLRPAG